VQDLLELLLCPGDASLELLDPARCANQVRSRPTHRFPVGSVTKTIVATAVLQLVGEGKLSLGYTVDSWLPGVVPRGDRMSVEHLSPTAVACTTSRIHRALSGRPAGSHTRSWA
jgi:Beta-lactamase